MSTIISLKKSPNAIQFKINNKKENYEISLINGLRRIILVNLDSFCFSRESIQFQKNTSIYNEDFMSQRFSLIPLNAKEFSKLDLTKVEAHFHATCTNIVEPTSYYAKDIKLYYLEVADDGESEEGKRLLDNSKYITIPDILLANIKPTQEMNCTFQVKRGNHKENGGMYCPVSKCIYYFESDSKDESPIAKEKDYLKTKSLLPLIYNFELETDGMYPILEIFSLGCDYFIQLLQNKIEEIKKIETSTTVYIETSPTNMTGYDFIFEKSDDTLGNVIQTYGIQDKDIHYIGYHIPHPLDRKLFIRLSLVKDKASRNDYDKKIIQIMQHIISILEGLKSDYLKTLGDI
jgi:DNA-directed RNA polymerase subunit L